MASCTNCQEPTSKNYCSNCGQPVNLKRIDAHYVIHEIEHVLHFEKGIFYTIKELLIRPGTSVKEFISLNRSRLVKPIIFIILCSLAYSLALHFFHVEDGYVSLNETNSSATRKISEWVKTHYGYANIIIGIFSALWIKLFFRKYQYNFFEILILLCFLMGVGMLISAAFVTFEGLTHISVMQISGVIFFIYCGWGIGQFFDRKKPMNYLKAIIAYILGMATFGLLIPLLGLLIDQFSKH